jgi:predicted permease
MTLALGIGATTAIFSVVYSVLIKPLPYPDADELVRIRHPAQTFGSDDMISSLTQYLTYRDENRTLAEIGMWQAGNHTLTGTGEPERLLALQVTDGTLQALGVQPMRGRWFTEEEHGPATDLPVPVILSYGFWQRRFGGDEAALGRELSIDSQAGRVVGIMPADFRFLDMAPQPEVIAAIRLDPARQAIGVFDYQALARLRDGVTRAEAQADIDRMLPIWLDSWPIMPNISITREAIANWGISANVQPLKDDLVGSVASTLWVFMGAIGAVLLIACANIANLMLVRADTRRQEFAVRAALGAVPARIARELLVESLCLGTVGGALGLVLAYLGLQALVALAPDNLPRLAEISVHPPVLAFTAFVSLASTLLFGSITALKHALNMDAVSLGAARGSSTSRERNATRNLLVVVQVALALVLIVSAALMIRTFQALREIEPGFTDPAAIQTTRFWVSGELVRNPEQYTLVEREILERIEAIPGVTSAGFSNQLPMEELRSMAPILVEDRPLEASDTPPPRRMKFVSPGYFETMGTRLIAGRDVTFLDDWFICDRRHQHGGVVRTRRIRGDAGGRVQGTHHASGDARYAAKKSSRQLHVHVDHSRGTGIRCGV